MPPKNYKYRSPVKKQKPKKRRPLQDQTNSLSEIEVKRPQKKDAVKVKEEKLIDKDPVQTDQTTGLEGILSDCHLSTATVDESNEIQKRNDELLSLLFESESTKQVSFLFDDILPADFSVINLASASSNSSSRVRSDDELSQIIVLKLPEEFAAIEGTLASAIYLVHSIFSLKIEVPAGGLARHATAFLKLYKGDESSESGRLTEIVVLEDVERYAGPGVVRIVDSDELGEGEEEDLDSQTKSKIVRSVVLVEPLEVWQHGVIIALLRATGLPFGSSMQFLDILGECFVCKRCKVKNKKVYSWKTLVNHFLEEYDAHDRLIEKWESLDLWGGILPHADTNMHDVCNLKAGPIIEWVVQVSEAELFL
ncbi:hypothetical protein SCHPADRAFT_907324 [Schizopora paradoxa]|uniref:Uncharacterized protein n=1 Tax=Schizopora paradoxa TaxID=27342 RepID=A0A0H2REI6_9AGAM|nr:hypothetical protein SCHPADRAFT_907324 [Schizopora paradoxa]